VPRPDEHLTKAENNEKLARATNRVPFAGCAEWAISMLFYAALHRIQAYLSAKGSRPLSHQDRDREIESNGSLSAIYGDYRRLKDMSRAARYEMPNYVQEDFAKAAARLEKIKNHMSEKMN